VVTTLHGLATVARTAVPQETPLKFKDDVFYQDRISTKESSIVRVLLGGKALVTVRELSVLTITEEPGRATVDLHSGKIALAVARKLMRSGEVIEIRTPNAIAAVRGTVIIVELIGNIALFNVLSGVIAVSLPTAPTVTPVTVNAGESLPVSPTGFGAKGTVSPTATQGLTGPPQFSGPPAEAQQQASSQQTAQAAAIALALLPPQPTQQALPQSQQPSTSTVGVQDQAASQAAHQQQQGPAPTQSLFLASNVNLQLDAGTSLATFSAGPTQDPGSGAIVCATTSCPSITLTTPAVAGSAPGGSTISVSGPGGTPLIAFQNSTLTATTAPVSPLFSVNGVNLTTTTPILLDPSSVTVAAPLYDSVNANVTVTGPSGLLPVARLEGGSTLRNTVGPVFRISGGSLTADALGISDSTGNMFDLTGTLLDISNSGRVTLRTLGQEIPDNNRDTVRFNLGAHEPLVRLSSGHLTLNGPGKTLVDFGVDAGLPVNQAGVALIAGFGTSGPSTLDLSGRLLDLGGVNLTENLDAQIQVNGATVTQTGTDPLVDISGLPVTMAGPLLYVGISSEVTAGGPIVHFGPGSFMSNTTGAFIETGPGDVVKSASSFALLDGGASVTLRGKLLDASGSTLCSGSTSTPCSGGTSSFISVNGGASLKTMGTADPLISLAGASVKAGGSFLEVTGTGSRVDLSGALLTMTNGTLNLGGSLLKASGGATITAGSSIGSVTLDFRSGTPGGVRIFDTLGTGGEVTGQEWKSRGIIFSSPTLQLNVGCGSGSPCLGADKISPDDFRGTLGGQFVVPNTTIPSFVSSLSIDFCCEANFPPGSTTTLLGPTGNVVAVLQGDVPTRSGTFGKFSIDLAFDAIGTLSYGGSLGGSLVSLSGGGVTTGGDFLNISGAGSKVELNGGLLDATNSVLTLTGGFLRAVDGGQVSTNGSADPFVSITGGTHSIATKSGTAVFDLQGRNTLATTATEVVEGITLNNLGTDQPLLHQGTLLQTAGATIGGTTPIQTGVKIDTALLAASAPLLNLTGNSALTFANEVLLLSKQAKVTAFVSADALVKLTASNLTVNNHFVTVAGGSRLVANDLVQLINGSNLSITGGGLLNVTGNSVVQIGTLVRFSNTPGNTSLSGVTISNSIPPTLGVTLAGFPVSVPTGANLIVTNPTPIVGLGTSGNIVLSPGGSLLAVSPGSTLRVGP
jgi:hypothetical protein